MPYLPGWKGDAGGGTSVICHVWMDSLGGREMVKPSGGDCEISAYSCLGLGFSSSFVERGKKKREAE